MKKALPHVLLLCAALASNRPARAALVVFDDGRLLRVDAFALVEDERLSLTLDGGGTMTIPLDAVDRIIDEEYDRFVPEPMTVASQPAAAGAPASLSLSVRAFASEVQAPPRPYGGLILDAGRRHRIDPALIAAVIQVESNYSSHAVSRKGARGLMQLMPATARRLGVKSAFDPRDNIHGGAAYLAELATRFGDTAVDLILAAYNAGERSVETYRGVPPYRETREYVRKVRALWSAARGVASSAAAATVSAPQAIAAGS